MDTGIVQSTWVEIGSVGNGTGCGQGRKMEKRGWHCWCLGMSVEIVDWVMQEWAFSQSRDSGYLDIHVQRKGYGYENFGFQRGQKPGAVPHRRHPNPTKRSKMKMSKSAKLYEPRHLPTKLLSCSVNPDYQRNPLLYTQCLWSSFR